MAGCEGTPRSASTDAAGSTQHLGHVMSRVSRQLQQERGDVEATLQVIVATAVGVVPAAEECSVSTVTGRSKVEPRASTSDLPREVDALQGRIGQGPCLDAVWETEVVRVVDVAAEGRWPEFARQAAELGVGSMMCFQLFVTGDQLGALNVYSHTPRVFDDESQEIGQLLAAHAALALAGAENEQNLRAGMASRDIIGQAKGILMERHRLTADQAFGVLTRVSQELNRKLVDVAGELADTGLVPGSDLRRD
ncbi:MULTISPECIES: GAF and ANTAR domain-containing protein [unclassified Modestobacter]